MADFEGLSPKNYILIKGARSHNLKNIDVAIPRNSFVVITGLSGSGKSSLAFDTLFAEGQRRYVESLSSYARQFLGRLNKPEVDYIQGIAPAVAIEQKVSTRNPRSTVGTSTEIFDYLKLLFARLGNTYSPISGSIVKKHSLNDVIHFIENQYVGEKFLLCFEINKQGRSIADQVKILLQQGYSRAFVDGKILQLEDLQTLQEPKNPEVIMDRGVCGALNDEDRQRFADSIQTAFFEGRGSCSIKIIEGVKIHEHSFSNLFEADGMSFEEPSPALFSFNTSYGACPTCEGFGQVIGIDEDLVVPNKNLSVYEDCIVPWRGEKLSEWRDEVLHKGYKVDFPIHKPYKELNEEQRNLLWNGCKYFGGIHDFFKDLESNTHKIQYRVMLSRFRGKTKCHDCKGSRMRKEASYVKIQGKSLAELCRMPATDLLEFISDLQLNEYQQKTGERLLIEIKNRLGYLIQVGLGYLTIDRASNTLSGGESQRINLSTALGSSLVGSMYILDEPSIGLHPRDTHNLIGVLKSLQKLGNSVIVVEHDEEIMRASQYLIDIGPGAGTAGGEVIYAGLPQKITAKSGHTGAYLTGNETIEIPSKKITPKNFFTIKGAHENNLKNIDVSFPLGCFVAISGVSGSGKSTLVNKILYPLLQKEIQGFGDSPGKHEGVEGNLGNIKQVEYVDQNPIGKSSRSNPVTYLKAFDDIRELFASQKISKLRGYKGKHFSFNVAGGRCDTCEGEGTVTIEMQFMADVNLICESCHGERYKREVLEVKFHEKNISDVLKLTVDEAIQFFTQTNENKIAQKLKPLQDVGLGYVQLGQSSSTLSGGEAQRVKLATFLSKGSQSDKTLFIFDEPTTGLHFHDIKKLLKSFYALLEKGHTIFVIEHHGDVIKCADWVIDLGPEGGEAGGHLVYAGPPEGIVDCEESYTGRYLKNNLLYTFIDEKNVV